MIYVYFDLFFTDSMVTRKHPVDIKFSQMSLSILSSIISTQNEYSPLKFSCELFSLYSFLIIEHSYEQRMS